MPTRLVSIDDRQRLLDVFLQVRALRDADLRDTYVSELEQFLRRPLNAARFVDTSPDLGSVLSACFACSGGLQAFVNLVLRHHPDDPEVHAANDAAVALLHGALLAPPDRDTLQHMISRISIVQIAEAVAELVEPGDLATLPSWRDVSTAIDKLERLPTPDDGVPQLLTFVDRLAHIVGGGEAKGLRAWTELVAGGLGLSPEELRVLRATTRRSMAEGRLRSSSAPAGQTASDLSGEVVQPWDAAAPAQHDRQQPGLERDIWGNVPIRNRNFTGRAALLQSLTDTLRVSSKASVLPQAVRGLGGVGKTQLVVEYVYLNKERYDVVWWMPAEQVAAVLVSLSELARRLDLPVGDDAQQSAQFVLNALATSRFRWLLVYDNAEDVAGLTQWVPSAGGHVILTSRNAGWPSDWRAIEVDVFDRSESVEFLQKRLEITEQEADTLAEELGDLPLALEQAASWQRTTGMQAAEYVEILKSQGGEILSEGKPPAYSWTVAAFVGMAMQRLRKESLSAAQLMEMFAFLGSEPVPVSLLQRGKRADISEPLKGTLNNSVAMGRLIRDLPRYGLAKVDPGLRVQVHRLVRQLLRESLTPDLMLQSRHNVQQLLAAANPGDPDELTHWAAQAELGPHIEPAGLIDADSSEARQVVLYHARYLYLVGDYEGSRRLAENAVNIWQKDTRDPQLGPDGELTLLANRHLANACRSLGDSERAKKIVNDTYERLLRLDPPFGPRHEYTLVIMNQVGHDLRIAGKYREALKLDRDALRLHEVVFGETDHYTLRVKGNLGVDMRMIGDFTEAYKIDQEVANEWEQLGRLDPRAFLALTNVARDLYGMGRYQDALDLLVATLDKYRGAVGPRHTLRLLAARTHAIALRKVGKLAEARSLAQDNLHDLVARFGPDHEYSVAAAMSYANVLRVVGELDEARKLAEDTHRRYLQNFGRRHPLTLCAIINLGALHRACGELTEARARDEDSYPAAAATLGEAHPYTLCAAANLATDLALHGEHASARERSLATLRKSRETRGNEHPDTLACAINAALDLQKTDDLAEGRALYEEAVAALRATLGPTHPDVLSAEQGQRLESDIEPPPT